MCDFSVNWIAWLDEELLPEEDERARRHLDDCSECRSRVDTYRQVALAFGALCDEQMTTIKSPQALPWAALISAACAIAAVVALLIFAPWGRVRHPAAAPQGAAVSVAPAVSIAESLPAVPRRVEKAHRNQVAGRPVQVRHLSDRRARGEYASPLPYEPVIEISIPAEEMLPPGALPAGMGFAADVAIGADGSADRLQLRPRLVGFERGIP